LAGAKDTEQDLTELTDLSGARIHITGIVQGVGFRPFVYGLAARLGLAGWVRNTSSGVDIVVDGPREALETFIVALKAEAPPLSRIDSLDVVDVPANGFKTFEIVHSEPIEGAFQPISPDVCICDDCLREMIDPHDRRYLYPFINCTNCGPRFTIIADIPYDRPKTTMASFDLCPQCMAEYTNPLNRRFHAQPVACPECGPHIWLETAGQDMQETHGPFNPAYTRQVVLQAQSLLAAGKTLAIKGLGGFHLACDATNPQAVAALRQRKLRVDKPFALMLPDLQTIERYCLVSDEERELLISRQRPIVILQRRSQIDGNAPIAVECAPCQDNLGIMLPYTPLHYLLFYRFPGEGSIEPPAALVMTSGNLSEEPIAIENQEARQRLASLADAFLMHDRPIRTRCDDSVVRIFQVSPISAQPSAKELKTARKRNQKSKLNKHQPSILPIRRSRGYSPFPVQLPWSLPPLLAAGAELKNTFCVTREHYAFLSHHIGDMENYETLRSFEDGVEHFERLFRITPEAMAYDLHPNYLASRYIMERANRQSLPAVGVQHHHAHIAACMVENGLHGEQPVIGVSFDGTGYGEDGAIWGGEFLLASYGGHPTELIPENGYARLAHLAYVPLPGGDAAVRKPARTALANLWQSGLQWEAELPCVEAFCAEERMAIRSQLEHRLNSPQTSSMGRLFDAVAALAGVRQKVNYEGQAAIELEALVDPSETGSYPFELVQSDSSNSLGSSSLFIDARPLIHAVVEDKLSGAPASLIAARFHNGVATMVLEVCQAIKQNTGCQLVALSGGVWQNVTLVAKTLRLLQLDGFIVYTHHQVPPNDGGLALGQAIIAAHRLLLVKN
jgi:hydrogenase maturation protein HypF